MKDVMIYADRKFEFKFQRSGTPNNSHDKYEGIRCLIFNACFQKSKKHFYRKDSKRTTYLQHRQISNFQSVPTPLLKPSPISLSG